MGFNAYLAIYCLVYIANMWFEIEIIISRYTQHFQYISKQDITNIHADIKSIKLVVIRKSWVFTCWWKYILL